MLKYAVYALAICLVAIILLPDGVIAYRDIAQRIEVARFYARHPLLTAMKATVADAWTLSSKPAREVLLRHVPRGTDRASAIASLSKAGFHCTPTAFPANEERLKAGELAPVQAKSAPANCELLAPTPGRRWLFSWWSIHLWFDDDGHLLGADVNVGEVMT